MHSHTAQSRLAALERTPYSPRGLRLLAAAQATRGPSHPYPRHFNPRFISFPFEPLVYPPTPLIGHIDLPDVDDEGFPTPPIIATPMPTVATAAFAPLLTFAPPPPPPTNAPVTGPARPLRSCMRQGSSRQHRPLPTPPARRSVAASDAASVTAANNTPRAPHTPAHDHGVPLVDALLALPTHPSVPPTFTWDVLFNPFKSLFRPENVLIRNTANLRNWAAIRKGSHGFPEPLTSIVLVLEGVPGLEITVQHSTNPPLSPSSMRPHAVTLQDVLYQLYRELREPLSQEELAALSVDERVRLRHAADARVRCQFENIADMHGGHARNGDDPLRMVDRLGRRRRFLGIRPACGRELPPGRDAGDVFVVELGMC